MKHIVLQNNFLNINLQTIRKQLTRVETKIQQPTVLHHSAVKSSESVKLPEQKLKTPIFKPFQVSKQTQQQIQSSKLEFAQAIRDQLSRI